MTRLRLALCLAAAGLTQQLAAGLPRDELDALYALHGSLKPFASRGIADLEDGAVIQSLRAGDPWGAVAQIGAKMMSGNTEQIGMLMLARAISELGFLKLAIDSSYTYSIDDSSLEKLAGSVRDASAALEGDRMALAIGYLALSLVMRTAAGFTEHESMSSLKQAWWLGRQAASARMERICEVGFNAGHSALAMLMSTTNSASVLSFDLNYLPHTRPCAQFVARVFPGRHTLIEGYSNVTVPKYAREHAAAPRCDLILVDGGHTEAEAFNDLLSMTLLAKPSRTLVIMDDVGCPQPGFCDGPSAAWAAFTAAGRIQELGCEADANEHGSRRWCFGVYT